MSSAGLTCSGSYCAMPSGVWEVLSTPLLPPSRDEHVEVGGSSSSDWQPWQPGATVAEPSSPTSTALQLASDTLLEHMSTDSIRRTAGLEAFFDATRAQLRALFGDLQMVSPKRRFGEASSVDTNHCLEGLVDFFGLSETVRRDALDAFAAAVAGVGNDAPQHTQEAKKPRALSFEQFEACASALKLKVLLGVGGEGGGQLTLTEYSRTRLEQWEVRTHERRQWLHGERSAWAANRWVDLQADAEGQCLKLLAVKYGIHPLALEDALAPRMQRSKAAHFEGHLVVFFPTITVCRHGSFRPHLHSGSGGGGSAIAACLAKSRLSIDISLVSIFLLTPSVDTLITAAATPCAAFGQVHRKLKLGYSLLRQSSCLLLLHKLIDALVDEIGPASDAVDAEVRAALRAIRGATAGRRLDVEGIHDLQQEARRLLATVLPLPRVVSHVRAQVLQQAAKESAWNVNDDERALLHDLEDRLETEIFNLQVALRPSPACISCLHLLPLPAPPAPLSAALAWTTPCFHLPLPQAIVTSAERLGDELRKSIDLETNRVLNTLTIVSSIFVPGNFLAAVW